MSDDFLSRWSRRKRAQAPAEADPASRTETPRPDGEGVEADVAEPTAEQAETEGGTPAAEAEASPLPPVETLTVESDLAPFLRAGVPRLVRNAALRRMWSLDPSIRDFVSEAREYAYDWNAAGGVPGLGPLLPSDDVKAMVRRIFEGAPPPAPDEVEDPPPAPSLVAKAAPPETGATESTPPPGPPAMATQPQDVASGQAEEPAPATPLRRHGSATPV